VEEGILLTITDKNPNIPDLAALKFQENHLLIRYSARQFDLAFLSGIINLFSCRNVFQRRLHIARQAAIRGGALMPRDGWEAWK
jgi:hypothetical protein